MIFKKELNVTEEAQYKVAAAGVVADEPACMPALTKAANGDLLVAFSTEWEPMPWGGVLKLTASRDQGKSWSEPRILWQDDDPQATIHVGNGMTTLTTGEILLPVTRCVVPKRRGVSSEEQCPAKVYDLADPNKSYEVYLLRSRDHGRTWARERPDPALAWLHFGRLLEARDGRLIMPGEGWYVESRDFGRTWGPKVMLGVPTDFNETNIVEAADGTWFAVMRQDGGMERPRRTFGTTFSGDGGKTWEEWRWTDVIGKMPDFPVLPSGRILMAVGGEGLSTVKAHAVPDRLSFATLFYSDDHGRTWIRDLPFAQAEPGTRICPCDGPVLCPLDDGSVLAVLQAIDLSKKDHPLYTFSVGMSIIANVIVPTQEGA